MWKKIFDAPTIFVSFGFIIMIFCFVMLNLHGADQYSADNSVIFVDAKNSPSLRERAYLDWIGHSLDTGDRHMANGDLGNAAIYYDYAYQANQYVTMHDPEYDMRIVISQMLVELVVQHNPGAMKKFIQNLLKRVEYRDGSVVVELKKLEY